MPRASLGRSSRQDIVDVNLPHGHSRSGDHYSLQAQRSGALGAPPSPEIALVKVHVFEKCHIGD